MVQERVTGNGNFDIDAIRMAANAMENAPAVIDQPLVDPIADAFAADVDDMVDELRFNPSSNLTEEAQQIMNSPLAARLGAGVMADLRAAVQLQEEKASNGADAFTRGDRVWEEQKEKREKERAEQAKIDAADDMANASKPMTPEQWDEAPSSDYPGMTNAEALAALRRINANLPFFSQLAVNKGLIKPEDELAFQAYMRNELWLKEQERIGNTNTDEYRMRKQQQEQTQKTKPEFKPAAQEVVRFANARSLDNEVSAAVVGAQAGEVGENSTIDSGTAALTAYDGALSSMTVEPVSVAKSLDQPEQSVIDQPSLTTAFNASANGAVGAVPSQSAAAQITPAQPVRVASANFDQSVGMI